MILGLDVSHYEPPVDWLKARNSSGVRWMYTKATEGVNHKDLMLRSHVNQAKMAEVLTGAYHFFHPKLSGSVQADFFLSNIKGMSLELPPVLDWEMSDGVSPEDQIAQAHAWLNTVRSETGRLPIIYGGESFLQTLKLPVDFQMYPLWLAHYGVGEGRVHTPKPWSKWTMWQYTDAAKFEGLASGHHVDANWFNGDMLKLKAL